MRLVPSVKPIGFLLVLATLAAGCRAAASANAASPPLVERVLAAYGVPAARAAMRAYRMTGTLGSAMRAEMAPMSRTFARPDSLRVAIDYSSAPETRILAGHVGWRSAAEGTLMPVEGPLLASMALQAARANLPWILEDHRSSVREIDALVMGSRTLPGLEIDLAEGMTLRLYVDPQTWLVVRTQSLLATAQFSTVFETVYSDFRDVAGVRFAFREDNFASGSATGFTAIEQIEANPRLDPRSFGPALPPAPPGRRA